jgi:hypothetical protein
MEPSVDNPNRPLGYCNCIPFRSNSRAGRPRRCRRREKNGGERDVGCPLASMYQSRDSAIVHWRETTKAIEFELTERFGFTLPPLSLSLCLFSLSSLFLSLSLFLALNVASATTLDGVIVRMGHLPLRGKRKNVVE